MLMTRGICCVVVTALMAVASAGHAATLFWDSNTSQLWDDVDNWNGAGVVPTATDDVNTFLATGLADPILIDNGDVALSQDLLIGPEDRNTRIVVEAGGSLQFRNMFLTVFGTPNPLGVTGEVVVNGGTVSSVFDGFFGGRIFMGGSSNANSLAKITQNGGLVTLDDALFFENAGAESLYELNGGIFNAKFVVTSAPSSVATIDMTPGGGTLVLDNFGHFTNDLLSNGYITIDGVPTTDINDFAVDFDTYPDQVGLTVIPEPTAAALLVLGWGITLISRRRRACAATEVGAYRRSVS